MSHAPNAALRRMTEPPPIPPLTRNGYTRTEATEADIQTAWHLEARDLTLAFGSSGVGTERLCAEALVFFIRRELRGPDRRTAEALFQELVMRVQRAMRRMIRGIDEDARYDIQAEVLADLTQILLAEDDRGDFLQSRFWLYIRRKATTARTAWLRANRMYALASDCDDDRPSSLEEQSSNELTPEDLAILVDALDRLPPELRELVVLKHYEGWRVGDDIGDRATSYAPTLAERYGITPRAVRKRLQKAEALLRQDQKDDI